MAGKVYVGITDGEWYDFLRQRNAREVNFWKPSGKPFKVLEEGDLFLFKLKAARGGVIAGGGFFASATNMPIDWAWRAFGTENGVATYKELRESICRYRERTPHAGENPAIGCIVLTDVFYLDERDWFVPPGNWRAIVQGKSFAIGEAGYQELLEKVEHGMRRESVSREQNQLDLEWDGAKYSTSVARHRLGQGAFRVMVADAYERRCAISGERTLPVLQAAHIRPYAQDGPHAVQNGLLLRADIHTLFDEGYLTVTPDYRVEVSRRLNADYGNGRIYYAFQGRRLAVLPKERLKLPSKDFLEWHNDSVFMR